MPLISRLFERSVLSVALLLVGWPLHGAGVQEAEWPPASWTEEIEPFEVADGLYYVGTSELAAYLFTGPAGHILLDVPMAENVDRVERSIQRLGFSLHDVRLLLISHAHFDHVGGLAEMKRRTGAEVVALPESVPLLESGGLTDFYLSPEDAEFPPVSVDRVIAPGAAVRLGPWQLTAHWTPGHTRGCTSWSFDAGIEGSRVPAVVVCSLSVLNGYRLSNDNPSYPGIGRDFCSSVEQLRSLPAEVFLANHASFIGLRRKRERGPTAFVDRAGLDRFLDRAQQRIETTLIEQAPSLFSDRSPGAACAALLETSN